MAGYAETEVCRGPDGTVDIGSIANHVCGVNDRLLSVCIVDWLLGSIKPLTCTPLCRLQPASNEAWAATARDRKEHFNFIALSTTNERGHISVYWPLALPDCSSFTKATYLSFASSLLIPMQRQQIGDSPYLCSRSTHSTWHAPSSRRSPASQLCCRRPLLACKANTALVKKSRRAWWRAAWPLRLPFQIPSATHISKGNDGTAPVVIVERVIVLQIAHIMLPGVGGLFLDQRLRCE